MVKCNGKCVANIFCVESQEPHKKDEMEQSLLSVDKLRNFHNCFGYILNAFLFRSHELICVCFGQ